jgi:hypothetical protein
VINGGLGGRTQLPCTVLHSLGHAGGVGVERAQCGVLSGLSNTLLLLLLSTGGGSGQGTGAWWPRGFARYSAVSVC